MAIKRLRECIRLGVSELLNSTPCSRKWSMHIWWKGEDLPLYILDPLLQVLAINRALMLSFEIITLVHLPNLYIVGLCRWTCPYFFQEKKTLQYSTECIDPLSLPIKDPTCVPNRKYSENTGYQESQGSTGFYQTKDHLVIRKTNGILD